MTFEEADKFREKIGAVSIMGDNERRYLYELASQRENWPICEVGVSHGGTTILFALACQANNSTYKVYAIDNCQALDHQKHFLRNIEKSGVKHKIEYIQEDSVKAASLFFDQSLGLVLIDADHEGIHPYADIVAWAPKVRTGGYLAVDDIWHPDVCDGILRYFTAVREWEFDWRYWRKDDRGIEQVKLVVFRKIHA